MVKSSRLLLSPRSRGGGSRMGVTFVEPRARWMDSFSALWRPCLPLLFSSCLIFQRLRQVSPQPLHWTIFSTSLSQETNVCYGVNRPNRLTNGLQAPRGRIAVNAYGVMLRYARFVNCHPSVQALATRVFKRSCIWFQLLHSNSFQLREKHRLQHFSAQITTTIRDICTNWSSASSYSSWSRLDYGAVTLCDQGISANILQNGFVLKSCLSRVGLQNSEGCIRNACYAARKTVEYIRFCWETRKILKLAWFCRFVCW